MHDKQLTVLSLLLCSGRAVSSAPPVGEQKNWATQIKQLPATPVVGHVLVRPATYSIETLNVELQHTHAHKRSITVPIAIPAEFARYLSSGARRAHGPHDDASGIDFVMRTIGKKIEKKEKDGVCDVPAVMDSDEDSSEASEDEVLGECKSGADTAFERMVDPSLLSTSQLRAIFGERVADLDGVFFQHSTRIAATAEFLPRSGCFQWRPSERAGLRRYCKGQVHPSVYVSALRSALASSNVPLSQNEVLVDLTGGTPEVVVAAIVVGFKKVIYIGDEKGEEQTMMQMPVQGEPVDWIECPADPPCWAWGMLGGSQYVSGLGVCRVRLEVRVPGPARAQQGGLGGGRGEALGGLCGERHL